MLCSQTYGIDLLLRALAWEDAKAPAGWGTGTWRRSVTRTLIQDVTRH
jgi:hypothetical protein